MSTGSYYFDRIIENLIVAFKLENSLMHTEKFLSLRLLYVALKTFHAEICSSCKKDFMIRSVDSEPQNFVRIIYKRFICMAFLI